jgi:hypothetical protein
MRKKKTGGTAFPVSGAESAAPGMSLRDWFAGQALASGIDKRIPAELAQACYYIADAMIAERDKE